MIKTIPSLEVANKMLKEAVEIYNNERRHCSLPMQTPNFAHTHQQHTYKSYKKQIANKIKNNNNVVILKDFFPAWLVIGNLSEQAGFLKERKQELKKTPALSKPVFLLKIEKEFPYF